MDLSATLEPLIENNALVGGEASLVSTAEDAAIVDLASRQEPAKKSKKGPATKNIPVWLPLKFRQMPKKGTFDVGRLKDSKYFFS